MTEVRDASLTLLASARELDELSKSLAQTEVELAPLDNELAEWEEVTHARCWEAHMNEEAKLPPESIRLAIAHRTFNKEKYARLQMLRALRNRRKRRISDLKEIVDAQRSIVSALKTELEASEGPQPQWSGNG